MQIEIVENRRLGLCLPAESSPRAVGSAHCLASQAWTRRDRDHEHWDPGWLTTRRSSRWWERVGRRSDDTRRAQSQRHGRRPSGAGPKSDKAIRAIPAGTTPIRRTPLFTRPDMDRALLHSIVEFCFGCSVAGPRTGVGPGVLWPPPSSTTPAHDTTHGASTALCTNSLVERGRHAFADQLLKLPQIGSQGCLCRAVGPSPNTGTVGDAILQIA
jgi:hypothetical protein